MTKPKFGLIAKGAREKAGLVARPTGPNLKDEPVEETITPGNDANQSQSNNQPVTEPIQPILEPVELVTEPDQPILEAVHPALAADKPVNQGKNQNPTPTPTPTPTRKTAGRKKKYTEEQEGPPNAARISRDAHKLLNMINSITGQTHSEIIDEMLVKHPLYNTLKPILKLTLE